MDHYSEYPAFINLKALAWFDKQSKEINVKGQLARTLAALIEAKNNGCTALEVSSWAYRFGAYVHSLRRDHGLDIQTLREEHPRGWHARYVLHTPVEILDVIAE